MEKIKKLSPILLALIILISRVSFPQKPPTAEIQSHSTSEVEQAQKTPSSVPTGIKVTRVIDGDTIEIASGQKIRYIGINAPETVAPGKPVGCFGHEASAKNRELVEGKEIRLEKDVSETDKYGRLLRYVYVGDTFINDELVREGYARVSTYPPDVKYQSQFLESEKYARENNLGLWLSCKS